MPLLLFPEISFAFWRSGRVLAPWSRLVGIEQTLLRRVESAYLVWWFGRRVPERRLALHIAIRNIAALRERFELAKRSRPDPVSDINLLGPVSGIAGMLVGAAMSPTGLILIVSQFKRFTLSGSLFLKILQVVGLVLLALPVTGLAVGLGVGLGLPLGLFAALGLGIAGDTKTRMRSNSFDGGRLRTRHSGKRPGPCG